MRDLYAALWIEVRKALRSSVPPATAMGFMVAPLSCALIMFIYKNPEIAQKAGLISAKANLMGATADWPTYLNMLAQVQGIGGVMLFSLIGSWLFGREFVDRTAKDLLALPVSRTKIVLAKFIVAALWSLALAVLVYVAGMGLALIVDLPQVPNEVILHGSLVYAITSILVIGVVTPFMLLASIGRGYLLPVGLAALTLGLANLAGFLGWGDVFPWSIPATFAALSARQGRLEPASYWIVAATSLAGMIATVVWWRLADHSR